MKKILHVMVSILALTFLLSSTPSWAQTSDQIKWQPERINVTVLQGTSQLLTVQLTVPRVIEQASLFVVPEIAGVVQMSLLGQTVLNPGAPIQAVTELSVPATTPPGTYIGTVHVRSGAKTVPATLKVQIQVVQGSSNQVVAGVADPSPDRIGRTSNGQFLVRDELVVALDRNIADPQTRIRDVAGQSGAVIIGSIPELLIYQLRIVGADVSSLPAHAASIRALAGVESVSRHFLSYPSVFPNDTIFSDWSTVTAGGLNRHLEFIKAPAAWDVTTGDASIRVAVIDVPIDDGHPDLPGIRSDSPRVVFNTRTANNNTNFPVSHGTIVSGTICASGNNGFGVTGVSWRCTLDHYSVAVTYVDILTNLLKPRVWCDENGWSLCKPLVSAVKVAKGMSSAVANGARIVNMSLQLVENNCDPQCTEDPSEAVKENNAVLGKAIQSAPNVLWVVAAGNEHRDAKFASPASLVATYPDRMLVVAAVTLPPQGVLVGSSVPKADYSNFGPLVDVAAPAPVTSTMPRVCDPICDDAGQTSTPLFSSYATEVPGTSVAAPQVAGLAVLVLSKHPTKTAKEVKDCIVQAANNWGATVKDTVLRDDTGTVIKVIKHTFKVIDAVKTVECRGPVIQPGPGQGKDIWTTSVFSFAPGGGGPGGGLDDDVLIVGGFGDLYYSLIQFSLSDPTLPRQTTSAKLRLYSAGFPPFNPTPMTLHRITSFWDWRTQGTGSDRLRLWWADQPATIPVGSTTQRPSILPAPPPGAFYDIDVTDLYNFWRASPTENFGLELRPVLNSSQRNRFFSSDYMVNPVLRPQLIVAP